jgi:4-hydroxyproline epimerase
VATALRFIDSHTGGEPTRLVMEGGPALGDGPLGERVARFRDAYDRYRSAIVNEPRGSDPIVGALLCRPHRPECRFGVIFFNNVGYLGMCGHGTIGLVASLAHAGQLSPGLVRLDTPAGPVEAELHDNGEVTIWNVASFRRARRIVVPVPGVGDVTGDVAYGGNWFFLTEAHGFEITLANIALLTERAWRIRRAVNDRGNADVDHVELLAHSSSSAAHSRNFVLCPGGAYDRSPCGTGTSAKLACLAADGELAEGEAWVQESVIGSRFTARYRWLDRAKGEIAPSITGSAYVTAEGMLHLDPRDPFCWGIEKPSAFSLQPSARR